MSYFSTRLLSVGECLFLIGIDDFLQHSLRGWLSESVRWKLFFTSPVYACRSTDCDNIF